MTLAVEWDSLFSFFMVARVMKTSEKNGETDNNTEGYIYYNSFLRIYLFS
jgi:hypothetical protein